MQVICSCIITDEASERFVIVKLHFNEALTLQDNS